MDQQQQSNPLCQTLLDKETSGATFIPATQRADGTWRKARRVKDGYVPQEEMPLYESKGKQWAKSKPTLPPGLHIESEEGHGDGGGILIKPPTGTKTNILIGSTPTNGPSVNNIPGLSKSAKKNAKRKEKKREKQASAETSTNSVSDVSEKLEKTTLVQASKTGANLSSDPVKRAKNLKKKLREIEMLQQKIDSGELPAPDKDQLEKIGRRSEIERELEELELSD